jgi:hypothetical protein
MSVLLKMDMTARLNFISINETPGTLSMKINKTKIINLVLYFKNF